MHRVVLEEVREGLRVGEVVDGDELEVLVAALDRRANDAPPDPSEAVDCDPRHVCPPPGEKRWPNLLSEGWGVNGMKPASHIAGARSRHARRAVAPPVRRRDRVKKHAAPAGAGAAELPFTFRARWRAATARPASPPSPCHRGRRAAARPGPARRPRSLALQVLRDELDELGGEAQDLVRRVPVATQLLEQRLGEDLRSLDVEHAWHHSSFSRLTARTGPCDERAAESKVRAKRDNR